VAVSGSEMLRESEVSLDCSYKGSVWWRSGDFARSNLNSRPYFGLHLSPIRRGRLGA
jgi:hypothetical protein